MEPRLKATRLLVSVNVVNLNSERDKTIADSRLRPRLLQQGAATWRVMVNHLA